METRTTLSLVCVCLLAVGVVTVIGSADHHQLSDDGTILIVPELLMLLDASPLPNDTSAPSLTFAHMDTIIQELYWRVGCRSPICRCLDATRLYNLLGLAQSDTLDEEGYNRAPPVLLFYIHDPARSCEDVYQTKTLEYFTNWLVQGELPVVDANDIHEDRSFRAWVQSVFSKIKPTYTAKPMREEEEEEEHGHHHGDGDHDHGIPSIDNEFCADAFRLLNDLEITTEVVTAPQASQTAALGMLHMLQGEKMDEHCGSRPYKEEMLRDLLKKMDVQYNKPLTPTGIQGLLKKLKIGQSTTGGGGHGHAHGEGSGHTHKRRRRATAELKPIEKCLSAEDLLYGVYGAKVSGGANEAMKDLAPAIIYQQVSGVCEPARPPAKKSGLTHAQIYGYGVLAVLLISLLSLFGVVLVPCTGKKYYKEVMSVCIGMAVGTLIADSVFHLMPSALGLHSHSDIYAHVHDGSGPVFQAESYHIKGIGIAAAIYIFFIVESIMANILPDNAMVSNAHGHSHGLDIMDKKNGGVSPDDVIIGDVEQGCCKSIKPVALMIIMGGILHNFADGLAIGAAFTVSLPGGLTTSFAVFCHEVPHELGDFAVLINSGMSVKMAALLNFLSALPAMVGMFIGTGISTINEDVQQWILTVAIGMFLYVALVEMVPELVRIQSANRSKGISLFFFQSLGFLVGLISVLLIELGGHSMLAMF